MQVKVNSQGLIVLKLGLFTLSANGAQTQHFPHGWFTLWWGNHQIIESNPIIRFLSQDFIEDPDLKVLSRDTCWWEYETSLPKEVVEAMFDSFVEIEEWA